MQTLGEKIFAQTCRHGRRWVSSPDAFSDLGAPRFVRLAPTRLRNDYWPHVVFHCATEPSLNILQDEAIMTETPTEAQAAIESAAEAIGTTLRRLQLDSPARPAVRVLTSSSSQ